MSQFEFAQAAAPPLSRNSKIADMTKRDSGFLLVGLGLGTVLAVVPLIVFVWFHHMFILGFAWRPGLVAFALPFLALGIGLAMIRGHKDQPDSN